MKFSKWMYFAATALIATLAQLAAQDQQQHKKYPHYKLIDLGTFGGPNSFIDGPTVRILSNGGTYGGVAETSIPDPFAPN